nr:MAG TPA: hypothetical protein [Caudoviricetes sp.]
MNQHSRCLRQQNHTFSRQLPLLILLTPFFDHLLRDLFFVAGG